MPPPLFFYGSIHFSIMASESKKNAVLSSEFKYCENCKLNVPRRLFPAHTRSNLHKTNTAQEISDGVQLITNAFNNALSIYRIQKPAPYRNENCIDYQEFFMLLKDKTLSVAADRVKDGSLLKINFELFCLFMLKKGFQTENHETDNDDEDITFDIKSFKSGPYAIVTPTSNLEQLYQESCDRIITKAIEFQVCV